MSRDDKLTPEEWAVINELREKYLELQDLEIDHLVVIRRMPGHWYIELSYEGMPTHSKALPYDVDIAAFDNSNDPLGFAIFYNDLVPLCKVHVFRYGGSGPIDVTAGSIRVF